MAINLCQERLLVRNHQAGRNQEETLLGLQDETYLWLDQDKVDEEQYEIVFNIAICELLAYGALRQPDPFSEGAIVGFAVRRVQMFHRCAAADAYRHG